MLKTEEFMVFYLPPYFSQIKEVSSQQKEAVLKVFPPLILVEFVSL